MEKKIDLYPSAAGSWTRCTMAPHFVAENRDRCDFSSGPAAERGSLLHKHAEFQLTLETPKPPPIEREDREGVNAFVAYVNGLREGRETGLLVEREVPLVYMEGRRSILDVIITEKSTRTVDIVDLKTGVKTVEAEENLQLAIYAMSLRAQFSNTKVAKWRLHIYMPFRTDDEPPESVWELTDDELVEFYQREIEPAAEKILAGVDLEFAPSEDVCRWCPAKAICAARIETMMPAMRTTADLAPAAMTDEQVSLVVRWAKDIRKLLADAEEYALERALRGDPVPGTKLVEGRSNRRWKSEEEAEAYLARHLRSAERKMWKLISPAQAEKALGRAKLKTLRGFEGLIEKPPGKPKIAVETDNSLLTLEQAVDMLPDA